MNELTLKCGSCEKLLVKPYRGADARRLAKQEDDQELLEQLRDAREGVEVRFAHFDAPSGVSSLYVCPGRRDHVPSETCRLGALKKKGLCPMCGERLGYDTPWPLPCSTCTAYAEAGYERARRDKEQGERSVIVLINNVAGLFARFDDGDFKTVLEKLLYSFGVETAPDGLPGVRGIDDRVDRQGSSHRVLRVLLDATQEAAIRELYRWLTAAVAYSRESALRDGADLLRGLVNGSTTIEAYNHGVLRSVESYQKASEEAFKKERG